MSLFDDDSPKEQQRASFVEECARHFANHLKQHERSTQHRRLNFQQWVDQFAILSRSVKDDQQIKQVLKWYFRHSQDDNVPKLRSAKAFRVHYDRLRELSQVDLSSVVITKEARYLQRLAKVTWPRDLGDEELLAIQMGLNNERAFRRKLVALYRHEKAKWKAANEALTKERNDGQRWSKPQPDLLLCVENILQTIHYPFDHVHHYHVKFNEIVWQWKDYQGKLIPRFVFSYEQQRVQNDLMHYVVGPFMGDARWWRRVKQAAERLYEENQRRSKVSSERRQSS